MYKYNQGKTIFCCCSFLYKEEDREKKREIKKESEIHRGVSVVIVDWRRYRARGSCLEVSNCTFILSLSDSVRNLRTPMVLPLEVFHVNICVVLCSRVTALSSFLICFFHCVFATRLWPSTILHRIYCQSIVAISSKSIFIIFVARVSIHTTIQ